VMLYPSQDLLARRLVKCNRMGRRLAEALARLSALVVELQELLDRASLEACEADADLCMGVRYVIRRLQAEVVERFQWVAEPPYCFACAGTPEGARSFLTQYEAVGVERHHRVSVSIHRRFEAQLRQLADGDSSSVDELFRSEVLVFQRIPLCTDVAEGYHRGAKLTSTRAPSTKMPFLFASARLAQNLEFVLRRCQEPGGVDEFRREYTQWKRILQTSARKRQRNKKIKPRDALAVIYRLGDHARVDWSSLGMAHDQLDFLERARLEDIKKIQVEYINTVVVHRAVHSIPNEGEGDDMYFEVLRKSQPWNLKRLHGVRRQAHGALTLLIQRYDVAPELDSGGERTLVPAGDPYSLCALEIGSWRDIRFRLRRWKAEAAATRPGALAISDAVISEPLMELTDATCPTFTVVAALRRLGWTMVSEHVTHTVAGEEGKNVCRLDMEARKQYFQAVLSLDKLRGQGVEDMPSNQPLAYYTALLRGFVVPPNLGAVAYRKVLKDGEYKAEAPPLAVVPVAAAAPLEDDEGSDEILNVDDAEALPAALLAVEPDEAPRLEAGGAAPDAGLVAAPLVAAMPAAPPRSSSSSSSSSSDSRSESDGVMEADAAPPPAAGWAELCRREARAEYSRYIFTCRHHVSCGRKRNDGVAQRMHYGEWEPIAYLMAWHELGAGMDRNTHKSRATQPTALQVREWLDRNGHL